MRQRGNITYISHKLNSFETGLGDKAIELSLESAHNLNSHFLGADPAGGGVGKAYENAEEMARNPDLAGREKAKIAFRDFCKSRRALIAEAFVTWVEELGPTLTISDKVKPEVRVDPSIQDRIWGFDYPEEIEDTVMGLIASGRLTLARRKSLSDRELVLRVKSSRDRKGFVIRFHEDRLEIEPAPGSVLYETLVKLMDGKIPGPGQGARYWVLGTCAEAATITSQVLKDFSDSFKPIA